MTARVRGTNRPEAGESFALQSGERRDLRANGSSFPTNARAVPDPLHRFSGKWGAFSWKHDCRRGSHPCGVAVRAAPAINSQFPRGKGPPPQDIALTEVGKRPEGSQTCIIGGGGGERGGGEEWGRRGRGRNSVRLFLSSSAASPTPFSKRALSIRQPYPELILRGVKTIEYRSRPTRIIGERFYINASRKEKGT